MKAQLLVLVLFAVSSGLANPATISNSTGSFSPKLRIVNGKPAAPRQFPWSGLMFSAGLMCSCTLIGKDRVLIAGHCVASRQPGFVFFGSNVRGNGEEVIRFFHDVQLHPKYLSSGRHAGYDVAVLKLTAPYELNDRINIAQLPQSNKKSYASRIATISGYGGLGNGQTPSVLQYADMVVLSRSDCSKTYGSPDDDKLLCGRLESSICSGDSGGGLVLNDSGAWRVIGVASVTLVGPNGGCDPKIPSGFVRVSEHLGFIKSVLSS